MGGEDKDDAENSDEFVGEVAAPKQPPSDH